MRIPNKLKEKEQIEEFARKRDEGVSAKIIEKEKALMERMLEAADREYMTLDDLIAVADWKSHRVLPHCRLNSEAAVEEITATSFAAAMRCSDASICALLVLRGVGWPMASVILHFAFPYKYPILDKMAMKAVDGSTDYTIEQWKEYTELCHSTAQKHDIAMRTLDKALWLYGKERDDKDKVT